MKATATRTLQAPQFAPITMTLEEECTPETFVPTLNKLADLIENTLRERYPQYANVLPKVEKKSAQEQLTKEQQETLSNLQNKAAKMMAAKTLSREEMADVYRKGIMASKTMEELESYKELAKAYDLTPTYIKAKANILNNNTLCTQ